MKDLVASRPRTKNDDDLIARLVDMSESIQMEFKRVSGSMVSKALETVAAFANTEGGWIVLGVGDEKKSKGPDRVFGIEENPEAVDELERKISTQITPVVPEVSWTRVPALLRDGTEGTVCLLRVGKSPEIHSIVGDGTFQRLPKSNRQMTATETVQLSYSRGKVSAETDLVDVDLDLLDTPFWRTYCESRRLPAGSMNDRLFRLGLAKKDGEGRIKPTRVAVLLFAEEPSGCLAAKCNIRILRYRGQKVEHGPVPNLLKTPKSITGPIVRQIAGAMEYLSQELAKGIVLSQSGFETVHGYPLRVLKEALTNAVLHRDYRVEQDIHVRIFDDRIEVESPGTFPGDITPANIREKKSLSRNPLLVNNIRDFPDPPNIDAGEGVRMMFQTMRGVGLYPPLFFVSSHGPTGNVLVILLNEKMPSIWEQVSHWLDTKGSITNQQLRQIAGWDTLKASRVLRKWVAQGLLVADSSQGKSKTVYRRIQEELLSLYLGPKDNETGKQGKQL